MSTEEDTELRDLVAQTLETNGVLNRIRAELRANVFLALDEQDALKNVNSSNKKLTDFLASKEGHQAYSLVREFLHFFNLDFSLAVLEPESNYVGKASSRENLKNELNLTKVESKQPLLAAFLKSYKEKSTSSSSISKKSISKIPQRSCEENKRSEDRSQENRCLTPDDLDNEDLLKEIGVSPISVSGSRKNLKPSILDKESDAFPEEKSPKHISMFGSLKDAPPLPKSGGLTTMKGADPDINSPEWDDLMKIDQKMNQINFKLPKEKVKIENKGENKYDYDDDFFVGTSVEKSDNLSIMEELEGEISIGSYAGSKADELLTTDRTVSQLSETGIDYGEDVKF